MCNSVRLLYGSAVRSPRALHSIGLFSFFSSFSCAIPLHLAFATKKKIYRFRIFFSCVRSSQPSIVAYLVVQINHRPPSSSSSSSCGSEWARVKHVELEQSRLKWNTAVCDFPKRISHRTSALVDWLDAQQRKHALASFNALCTEFVCVCSVRMDDHYDLLDPFEW